MKVLVLTGPESSGKSWLAAAIQAEFGGLLVGEYVRHFIDREQRDTCYADIPAIARGQLEWEDKARSEAPPLLILDTHPLSNILWSRKLFNDCPDWLERELLARRCKKVIAVDNSERMVEFGARKARKNGLKNLEFRLGNLQDPPIEPNSVDVVILSQALHHAEKPDEAIKATHRMLVPGGQLLILDLAKHKFERAHELYGERWLGFAESDLQRWLENAGFRKIEISVVAREEQPRHHQGGKERQHCKACVRHGGVPCEAKDFGRRSLEPSLRVVNEDCRT